MKEKPQNRKGKLGAFLAGVRDLLCGLFGLPAKDAAPDCNYAEVIEERYSKPRRCC